MAVRDKNIVWGDPNLLFKVSAEDGLYVMPWRLLHDGYQVTRQDTVVRVSPDSGVVISHSKWSAGGRIIAAKIYVDNEESFWYWLAVATQNTALPCWVYDPKVNGFMKCHITDQPTVTPAGTSVRGMYVNLQLYAKAQSLNVINLITENTPDRAVVEGNEQEGYSFVSEQGEVMY